MESYNMPMTTISQRAAGFGPRGLRPTEPVTLRGRETYVLVARGQDAEKVTVDLGYDDGIWAEVLSGLGDDEWIIIAATGAVIPGTPVKPVPVKQDA